MGTSFYIRIGKVDDTRVVLHCLTGFISEPFYTCTSRSFALMVLLDAKERAIQHFERSARLAPKDERAHLNLADALRKSGRLADAAAAYRRAIAINNDSFEAHVKLADLLTTAGRVKDAVPHLRRVVELRPNSADTHSDLGGALVVLGFAKEAEQHLRRALELDPNHAGAKQNLEVLRRR